MKNLTNRDLKFLSENIGHCATLRGIKISYAVAKNRIIIERELKAYNVTLEDLQLKHCKMIGTKPVMIGNTIQMKDLSKFTEAYEEFLDIEIQNFKLHNIKEVDIPADNPAFPEENISGEQMASLLYFTTEKDEPTLFTALSDAKGIKEVTYRKKSNDWLVTYKDTKSKDNIIELDMITEFLLKA